MSIIFKDPKTRDVLFEFLEKDKPEEFPYSYESTINEIKYPRGLQTNQIMGTYFQPIEFSGKFKGVYNISGTVMTAFQRLQFLTNLMEKRIEIIIPGKDNEGRVGPGEFIIKSVKGGIVGAYEANYTITLVPHQEQPKLDTIRVQKIDIKTDDTLKKINKVAKAHKQIGKIPGAQSGAGRKGPTGRFRVTTDPTDSHYEYVTDTQTGSTFSRKRD